MIKRQTEGNRNAARGAHIRVFAALGMLGAVACGVAEKQTQPAPSAGGSDFGGSVGGQPGATAGAAPIAMGGAAPGAGGDQAAAGASSVAGASSGGAASGGTSAGGAASGGATGGASTSGTAGSAPLSGVTITLGTNVVPIEHAIAFIHIGHSNMAGRATVPAASRPYHFTETDPHAWMYHVAANGGGGMPGPPALAIEPKTAGDTPGNAGPGTSLVKQAAALAPNTYFISLGYAVPSAYCSQFVPGALYYDKLMAAPLAIKGKVTFGAIFIYLGITERADEAGHTAADTANFPNCINTLVTAIRKDLGVPNLPLIENNYEVEGTGEFLVGGAVYNGIFPEIQKIPTTVSNSVLIPCDGLGMEDDHHFNLDGQKTWAQRALAMMQTKGWFPWK
jgi:Carbohydrate esterase, sialic acid-specific acetylesterase